MDCHKGIELYEKAKKIIPGGTQLFSKRPEMFLPDQWPAYYSKCKGVEVWDLDGNKFIDMSICGVGACILGYADPDVERAVKRAVEMGTMCTLNCPEEVELAELLCELHPWAEMVRFCRGGGEAMTIAVRLGRAATGRDRIAFCGYHGWHDWYLSANIADDQNLDGHLLSGLKPVGVPISLKKTSVPFNYNKLDEFNAIVNQYGRELAAIVMEPVRHSEPNEDFLQYIRKTADQIGAILIFDEVTSAWRMNVGGIHLMYGVTPDIAVFAKGISNGYPMAAIIGIRDVMRAAQKSFISSTYWTERIGPVAALATIGKMRDHNLPEHLCRVGNHIKGIWEEQAEKHGLKIKAQGIPPLSILSFDYGDKAQAIHTLYTQEMLNRGILVSKAFYATYAHGDSHIKAYHESLKSVFNVISQAIESETVEELLHSTVAHTGFKRLA